MFSSNFTDLLQILEMDKNKLLHFGPPRFRINIPCKYGNQCKYGRYSCEYSHESLCRFLKKGGKCLNINCTHQHEFPFEYQLAQGLLNLQMQLSLVPESFEARKSVSAHHFSVQTGSENGTSGSQEFCFKVNDSPVKSTENNLKTTEINLFQSPTKAESPFTAFSPLFQSPVNSRKPSADHSKQLSSPKPTQTYTKMDRNSPPINLTCSTNAQKSLKTSEINQKTAQQFQDLPLRNSASNQLPPPVKHAQKSRFYSQIKQTTSGNLTLATATPATHSFSPVFTSKNQNSLANSTKEVNFAGSPVAPDS